MSAEATNEPTNEPTTQEQELKPVEEVAKPADAAPSGDVPPMGGKLFTVFMFIVLLFFIVAAPIPWFRNYNNSAQVYLFKTVVNGVVTNVYDYSCSDLKQRFQAAETFAIISIFGAALSVLLGAGYSRGADNLKFPSVGAAGFTFCMALITVGIAVNAYLSQFCGSASWYHQHSYFYAGAALFIAGWVTTFFAIVFLIVEPASPVGDNAEPFGSKLFTFLSFVAFCFTVIGTPISWTYKWASPTNDDSDVQTLWADVTTVSGVETTTKVADLGSNCVDVKKQLQTAEAFAIISIVATLASAAVGFLTLGKTVSRTIATIVGSFAALSLLITWGIITRLYYYPSDCNGVGASMWLNNYLFGPGYALFVTSFAFIVFGTLVLFLTTKCECEFKPANAVFGFLSFVALLFTIVGTFTNWYEYNNGTTRNDLSLWFLYTSSGGVNKIQTTDDAFTNCSKLKELFRAGEAFAIISIGFTFFAFVAGLKRVYSDDLKTAASGLGFVACVMQIIAWGIGVGVYNEAYCSWTSLATQNYNIAVGLSLFIAAFCATLVGSILNLVL